MNIGLRPRSVYVHVPFCRHRCGYCSFALVADREYLVDRYLDAIATEITMLEAEFEIDTLYLGGGTPSRLSGSQLEKLKQILSSRFHLSPEAEFTAECNPADLDSQKAEALAEIGVNRISLGVQSLKPAKLKLLERDHDARVVASAVQRCKAFCQSLSLDLIFATENETLEEWKEDLGAAIELAPDHFSTYELTFEKGTSYWNRLQRGELTESVDDVKAEMFELTISQLERNGFGHYEVSSFARPDHQSQHNSVYWSGQDYFAFGPGASSYLGGVRATNHRSTMTYLKRIESGQSPVAESEALAPRDRALEHLVIGLRLRAGIDCQVFETRNGFDPLQLIAKVQPELESLGLLKVSGQRIQLTQQGVFVSDWVAGKLLSD